MATYESVEKALIELGFSPDVDRDRHDYDYINRITCFIKYSPKSDVNFSYREEYKCDKLLNPHSQDMDEEFDYRLDVTAPDGFEDLIIFDGHKHEFDVVEMERMKTHSFDYSQEKAFITDLHQKILKAIASV